MAYKKKENNIIKYVLIGILIYWVVNIISPDFLGNLSPQTNYSRNLYKKAREFQNTKDFRSAYKTFGDISSGYSAYDAVLLQQSKCAAAIEDEKTAVEKLKTLISRYPNSPLAPMASYSLGQAYIRMGETQKAEKQFEKTVKNYPETNYAYGSYYYLGSLNKKKDKNLAIEYWTQYLSLSPDGRFASDCIEGIKSLTNNPDNSSKKQLGIALYTAQKYRDALKYLEQIPFQDDWYYRFKSYEALGNNSKALGTLKNGISRYSKNVDQEQLQDAMLSYIKLSPQSETQSWTDIINFAGSERDFALFHKAQLIPKAYASQLYQNIVKYYPNSQFASEALWNLFWDRFNNNYYSQAIKLGDLHISLYTNTKASPKILFWTGKAYERIGQKGKALDHYKKLLSQYPDSYYAFRADGRIKSLNYGYDPSWKTASSSFVGQSSWNPPLPYTYDEIHRKFGKQIAELIYLEDYETVSGLIDDPFLESWIRLKEGLITKSIVLARDGMKDLMPKPGTQDQKWKLIYPLYYVDDIDHYANINNIDPILVLALIKEESHFNPLAVSSSNARGLMQLLPGTAQDVVRWNNLESIGSFQLFNPKVNIKLGTAYLRHLKDRLNNSSLYTVAGYNGGPGAVERWMKIIPNDDPDQFVENIPYDQTRDYVRKVFASYWNYKRIYNLN